MQMKKRAGGPRICIYHCMFQCWMAHFGITDRLDGPFHKKGRGRERMEQEWERVNREVGEYRGCVGVVWGGVVCGAGWGVGSIKQTQKYNKNFWVFQPKIV